MSELHPLFKEILRPYMPFKPRIEEMEAQGREQAEQDAPCGYHPGDCCAMGVGCLSCGENPELGKEAT